MAIEDSLWVVSIVEMTVPTEKTIGPFPTSEAAGDYIDRAHENGRWDREQWQRVGTLQLFPPDQEVELT